jgi:hypothetical protein
MGKKYSINSAGRIVAERDIYSLGGLIVKGSVGGSVKDETQLSQEGECWLNAGDISNRPDIVIKDNAYIGEFFPGENPVHTDIITEFSGNTKIPGKVSFRCFTADAKANTFIKDSFIGITMDVVCGPATNTKNFPMEQGRYNQDAPKGTLFTSSTMKLDAENFVRNTATLRIGKDTYVYTPQGFNARIYWAYYDFAKGAIAYAGETEVCNTNIYRLSHPVYNICMIAFAKNPTLTPAELEAAGARILGHVSGSLLMDLRPESVSGDYVMDNSSFIMNTDNFGLGTVQLRFLAGGLYNTNMYMKTDRQDYKPYGTFRNVERLEYNQYFADIHRGNVNRDHYIMASDSPLVRIGDSFVSGRLINSGGLTLRRCVVPKGIFKNDVIDGNTYEDIDFSYATEFLGNTEVPKRTLVSSHKQGLYSMWANSDVLLGRVSYPDNTKNSTGLTENHETIMLDGDMIESGTYAGDIGKAYEANKIPATNRVRMIRPVSTRGAVFPNIPAGYSVRAVHYLDESFILRKAVENPSTMEGEFPFYVMSFQKTDPNANLPASEFVSKNAYLNVNNYTKVPEITGSAYLGAGVIVRGDVQLHGDPYVNRVFDINEWDRGGLNTAPGLTWDVMKDGRNSDVRMTTKSIYPVNPGDTISVSGAYRILLCWFNEDRKLMSDTGWNDGTLTVPANVHYVGIALSTKPDLKFIDFSDVPLAGVKYLRAFKKRRYITNELDRKSPEDILLADYYWEQGAFYTDTGRVGRPYNDIKYTQSDRLRLSKPLPAGNATLTVANYWEYAMAKFDAGTRLLESSSEGYSMVSMTLRKAPPVTVNPSDAKDARLVITCIPQPRIIVPYGSNTLNINGVKIRMYDNAVLSRNFNQEGSITLQGDAVMGYDFDSGACLCSNGHDDAIIKLP